jgi:hypothetical protein
MLGIKHDHLDITGHIAPDQAQFEPKYFPPLTEGGPPLFNLKVSVSRTSVLPNGTKLSESNASTTITLQAMRKAPAKF